MKTEDGKRKNGTSGEILIACLVGLAIGVVASVVQYNGWAQERANLSRMEVGATDYMAEEPVKAFGLPIGGALLGAGVGALIDGFSATDSGNDSSVRIEAGGDVQYVGQDGNQEQGNRPTTTTSTTTTHPVAPAEAAP